MYKPSVTANDAKQHLHHIRSERQKEIEVIITECHQIRLQHKQIFDCRTNETFVWRKEEVIPTENDFIIEEESRDDFSESSSSIFVDNQSMNHRLLSPKKKSRQRCVSVSSVGSIDKRTNKIYEKWPDYTQISQIVGYRIEKPAPAPAPAPAAPPVIEIQEKKRKKSTRFVHAAKKIQKMSASQRDELKNKPIDDPPVVEKVFVINITPKEIQPKLPTILCPLSKNYSKRIQTRQWLIKNYFSLHTLPLI